ncbi:MAG TPA: MraY family glycosyltransferase [Bacteroidia bacterium]|nr:MraY family glycosyltransferase [Bacteroidia bacterium]
MGLTILAFITSFLVVIFFTPSLIKVAELKNLTDTPDALRKLHKRSVPTIGGIIIYAGTLFSYALWLPTDDATDFKYIVTTTLLMFFVGVKDDIIGTAPMKKLAAHILCALVIVLMANIRIKSLHGIFGLYEIPYWASIFLSLFTMIVIINAFNLIDGVDGLAAGIGFIAAMAFGTWFLLLKDLVMSCMAFALAGSLIAFLYYNFSPAKIFMGDSGSLTIGLIMSILAIKLIEFDRVTMIYPLTQLTKPVIAIAFLIYPLVDTMRIFIYRMLNGLSPFHADRNHIHHRLQDVGLTHRQTSSLLYSATILVIAVAFLSKDLQPTFSLLAVVGFAAILCLIPFYLMKEKNPVIKPISSETKTVDINNVNQG